VGWAFGRLRGRREPVVLAVPSTVAQAEGSPSYRFEQIMRSVTVGIVTLDGTGHVTALNAAASAIFDIGEKPAIGRALIELVPSIHLDRRAREALAGNPSRGTIELPAQMQPRTVTVTTLPIDGEAGAIVIVNDETRLHELEQTRRDFVSNVAHEVRTPLSSIKLMVETLLEASEDAEARRLFLPQILREVDRLVSLVEDLLDLARAESGQMVVQREAVDLSTLATAILKTFEPRAQALQISLHFKGEHVPMNGDSNRLAQVIVNLVDNALRHTSTRGSVSVAVARSENEAYLTVRDTGIGIPYNDLPHIFERFYVVDRSRARESSGTGLGLSIVKQIVEAHGGTVTADSELGRGAIFTCTFPLSRAS
jgi:two-component system phosphate regulon sensor histidine kinase PhoR